MRIDYGDPQLAPLAVILLGRLLEKQGDLDGARAAYRQAIDSGNSEAAPRAMCNLELLQPPQVVK